MGPPLPPELQDLAVQVARRVEKSEKQKAKELMELVRNGDFESLRKSFQTMHEDSILRGLESVFPGRIELRPAPIAREVQERFMSSVLGMPGVEMRPAWHGTDVHNHSSIFKTGLLIPGRGNNLKVVHGAAHGSGVYTANIDAAWLSRGFCTAPALLVCAVLQSSDVRHVGDAMVVGKA